MSGKVNAWVALSDLDISTARAWANAVEQTPTMAAQNYTGLVAPDRYLTGWLGEIATKRFLEHNGRRHRFSVRTDGRGNKSEFLVWIRGKPRELDVKTASKPTHRRLMFPEAQLDRHPVDLYVGARLLNRNTVELCGFMSAANALGLEVADFGYGVPTVSAKLDELRSMSELLELLDSTA